MVTASNSRWSAAAFAARIGARRSSTVGAVGATGVDIGTGGETLGSHLTVIGGFSVEAVSGS